MTTIGRTIQMLLTAAVLFAAPAVSGAELVRIGVPTKTYWPTTVAEAAKSQKFFEKEGITAEIHDLSRRRGMFRGAGGGGGRSHPRCAGASRCGPQEGRDVEGGCQWLDGQFRLAADGAGEIAA
jgi:hypothetical protein